MAAMTAGRNRHRSYPLVIELVEAGKCYMLTLDETEFSYGWPDIEWLTVNAMKSAFASFDERLRLINTVIKPGFATARAMSDAVVAADMLAGSNR